MSSAIPSAYNSLGLRGIKVQIEPIIGYGDGGTVGHECQTRDNEDCVDFSTSTTPAPVAVPVQHNVVWPMSALTVLCLILVIGGRTLELPCNRDEWMYAGWAMLAILCLIMLIAQDLGVI